MYLFFRDFLTKNENAVESTYFKRTLDGLVHNYNITVSMPVGESE